jgi:hypothetical protein|tara:strand:- start:13170 stop:13436 length:267 start_codon:yes stop_codon:yes gene_type:complete
VYPLLRTADLRYDSLLAVSQTVFNTVAKPIAKQYASKIFRIAIVACLQEVLKSKNMAALELILVTVDFTNRVIDIGARIRCYFQRGFE